MLTVLTVQSQSTIGHCTTYANLLCARMTYMYLSAIVAAKKISFIRMMVSPAASIVQFDLERGLQSDGDGGLG